MTTRRLAAALAFAVLLGCSGGNGGTDVLDVPGDVPADVPADVPTDVPTDLPADAPDATDATDPGPKLATLAKGADRVEFDTEALELRLFRGDTGLLVFPADGIRVGVVDELDDNVSYDPWPLAAELSGYDPPWGLFFPVIRKARVTRTDADGFDVRLTFEDGAAEATLTARADAEGDFRMAVVDATPADRIAYFRLAPKVDAQEGFYGLGAYLDDVNHRGKLRAMQPELDDLESNYNEAHVPVPLLIGTRGWGLFVASRYPGAWDVAKKAGDRVEAYFGVGAGSAAGLDFHLFTAAHPLDITARYYARTGWPRLPAKWALGPWIWRDEISGQEAVEKDLDTIRELDLATTGYWIDRPYASGVNAFDFHPDKYDDAPAMITKAHGLGMRMALWHTPYVSEMDEQSDTTKALLAVAREQGYHPPVSGLMLNKWGKPIDFTNPAAYAWWQSLLKQYSDVGIEGYKLDYAEDIVPGIMGVRNVWKFHDGSDERTMHHGYTLLYHQVYDETLPADGGFLLCRAGRWGDQANVGVIWPGDLDSGWWKHREPVEIDGKTVKVVGGLGASMIYGLNLAPSGFPFYGSDTGGYRHCPPDKELFIRWFQQTALSSVMQVGTSCNDVAWEEQDGNGFDQELLDLYRIYTRLHLRLWPYEWTIAQDLKNGGRPIQRPFGLAYPELGVHPNDQYLFGGDLLVAPVVEQGQSQREVILPPGKWVGWWDGVVREGGQTVTVDAPLQTLPLFLRAGGVVPMLRPTIDAIAPVADPVAVDSYATTPGVLYPVVFGAADGTFTLFDGAEVSVTVVAAGLELGLKDGTEFRQGAVFEVLGMSSMPGKVSDGPTVLAMAASLAELEAAASGWFWDATRGGRLYVKIGGGGHTVTVSL